MLTEPTIIQADDVHADTPAAPSTALVPLSTVGALVDVSVIGKGAAFDAQPVTAAERLAQWLKSLGGNTQRAYARDLDMFAAYLDAPNIAACLDRLVAMPRARALTLAEAWRDTMKAQNLSSATINRRLAAVNSALREIAKADIGPGRLDLKGMKPELRKDTRGPSVGKIVRAVEMLEERGRPRDVRNLAILRLAGQRGLRRSEITGLTLADVSLDVGEIRILRKGKREKVTVILPPKAAQALGRWLAIRGEHAATGCEAVFTQLGNGRKGGAMSAGGLFDVIRAMGESVGDSHWRPHGLRHTGITLTLKATGNLEAAREFAGHASVSTTQRYLDDKRETEQQAVNAMADVF
jgi:integrase/recombinase XerC